MVKRLPYCILRKMFTYSEDFTLLLDIILWEKCLLHINNVMPTYAFSFFNVFI